MSYPKTFDLDQGPVPIPGNAQVSNTKGKGQDVRGPAVSVTKALHNPFLPGNQDDWESIPTGDKTGTETTGSQTTATSTNMTGPPLVDAAAANIADSHIRSGFPKPDAHAPNALGNGAASQDHKSSGLDTSYVNVDEMSVSDMTASYHKSENKDPFSPAITDPQVAFEVCHMGPWANDKIKNLGK